VTDNPEYPIIETAVIFGGSGFIGRHLTANLTSRGARDVIVADIAEPSWDLPPTARFVRVDVRESIHIPNLPNVHAVFNLAAVHRTPGHQDHEYHDTNENGAAHITEFATEVGASRLWFTSSIAVYGPSEEPMTERSIPAPVSAYGKSKLKAEKIHEEWSRGAPNRRLITVRPATVFGPEEGGNFTRLAMALAQRRFVYPGRRDTKKACGYVGELIRTMYFAEKLARPSVTYNFAYPTAPTIEEVVGAFQRVAGYRRPIATVPLPLMLVAARVLEWTGRSTFHPDRVMKLVRSTNIVPNVLLEAGYDYVTDLESGLRAWYEAARFADFV
jgi:nucleoside-diphosphate-sugar epimerase